MKLLLVDGHYYLYRSFFAIRDLRNSRGQPTNAIYAFTKALRKMLADLRPTHGAVLWDGGIPARRLTLQPSYKQQRAPMPDDLRAQEDSVKDLCPLLGLPSICLPQTEADDLIASLTRAAEQTDASAEVVIASADKDLLQLVSDRVAVYSTAKADLARDAAAAAASVAPPSSYVLLRASSVVDKWGVPPTAIADILSLTGDAVDNIPGVAGVGEKTAAALLQEFGSLDALLETLAVTPEKIAKPALRAKLWEARDRVLQNREMVRLDEDIPSPLSWNEMRIQPQPAPLIEFLRTCEFRSLLAEVVAEWPEASAGSPSAPDQAQAPVSAPASAPNPASARPSVPLSAPQKPEQTDFFADLETVPLHKRA